MPTMSNSFVYAFGKFNRLDRKINQQQYITNLVLNSVVTKLLLEIVVMNQKFIFDYNIDLTSSKFFHIGLDL